MSSDDASAPQVRQVARRTGPRAACARSRPEPQLSPDRPRYCHPLARIALPHPTARGPDPPACPEPRPADAAVRDHRRARPQRLRRLGLHPERPDPGAHSPEDHRARPGRVLLDRVRARRQSGRRAQAGQGPRRRPRPHVLRLGRRRPRSGLPAPAVVRRRQPGRLPGQELGGVRRGHPRGRQAPHQARRDGRRPAAAVGVGFRCPGPGRHPPLLEAERRRLRGLHAGGGHALQRPLHAQGRPLAVAASQLLVDLERAQLRRPDRAPDARRADRGGRPHALPAARRRRLDGPAQDRPRLGYGALRRARPRSVRASTARRATSR